MTIIEVVVQLDKYDIYQARYAEVAQGIMNEILRCKKMSSKMESLEIQMNVT